MKKLLLLNGGHSEIPLIEAAKKLGFYVITTGNKPDLIGHQYADKYVLGDFSDQGAMLEIAKKNSVDAVCSAANDFGAISAAYVAEKLGLPGHDPFETAVLLHQKDRFKKFAKEINLQSPISDCFDSCEEALLHEKAYTYPLIVKPVDLTGGKGVSVIHSHSEYADAVARALERSRLHRIVIEKYIEGTYHSFSTFLVNKKVVAWFCDNEYSLVYPFFVDTSAGPADHMDDVKNLLIKQAELVAEKLDLVDGIFHMQYVMDATNTPFIIDITRRCSGDMYPEPVEHSTGIPWAKWIVMAEAGFPGECFSNRGVQSKICGRHCIMAPKEGIIKNVVINEELLQNIYKSFVWWRKGDIVYNHFTDKQGILFLEYATREEMQDKIARIKSLVRVVVE